MLADTILLRDHNYPHGEILEVLATLRDMGSISAFDRLVGDYSGQLSKLGDHEAATLKALTAEIDVLKNIEAEFGPGSAIRLDHPDTIALLGVDGTRSSIPAYKIENARAFTSRIWKSQIDTIRRDGSQVVKP